jgi:hypothetical protein
LNLVLKDIQSGNVGTIEKAFTVPEYDDETLAASSLILSDKLESVSTRDLGKGPFVIGSTKLRPSVSEVFHKGGTMSLYIQIYNLQADEMTHKPSAAIEYVVQKAGESGGVLRLTEKAEDIPGAHPRQMTLAKILPLNTLAPGRYTLRVNVTDNVANRSITSAVSFTVQ